MAGSISNLSAVIAAGGGVGMVAGRPDRRPRSTTAGCSGSRSVVVAATALIALRFVPESPDPRRRAASTGSAPVLLSGWLVALLLPLSQARQPGAGRSARVIGLFAAAVVLFALWLLVEAPLPQPADRHADDAAARGLDHQPGRAAVRRGHVRHLRVPAAVPADPAAAGYGFGASVTGAGLLMLPMLVAMFVAGCAQRPARSRVFGAKALLATGAALGAVACGVPRPVARRSTWQVAVAGGVFGLGIGLAFASMANLIVRQRPGRARPASRPA